MSSVFTATHWFLYMTNDYSHAGDIRNKVSPIPSKWIARNARRLTATMAAIALLILQGCSSPPAPSPTPNPHPTHTQKLKISVEKGSVVNRIEVESIWVVGDLSCAPVVWPSGSTKVKQVHVAEAVEKVGDDYIATLVLDRFLPDRCHWVGGAYGINFYHDKSLLGGTGGSLEALRESGGKFEGVCVPPSTSGNPAVCFSRNARHDQFLRSHFKTVFNETEELMP